MKFGHERGHQAADLADLLPSLYHELWLRSGKVWAPGAELRRPNIPTTRGFIIFQNLVFIPATVRLTYEIKLYPGRWEVYF